MANGGLLSFFPRAARQLINLIFTGGLVGLPLLV